MLYDAKIDAENVVLHTSETWHQTMSVCSVQIGTIKFFDQVSIRNIDFTSNEEKRALDFAEDHRWTNQKNLQSFPTERDGDVSCGESALQLLDIHA